MNTSHQSGLIDPCRISIYLIVLLAFLSSTLSFAQTKPYQDCTLSIDDRVNDLLKRMTLDEKVAQLRHIHQADFDNQGRFDIKRLRHFANQKSFGAFEAFGYSAKDYLNTVSTVNAYMRNETRLGIPSIPVMESLHGVVQDGCTIFPQSIAVAATFDPDLCYQMSVIIAKEMKAIGAKQTFAPVLDLAREQRWGRVEETYGEDPFLVSEMAVNYVKGIRSENLIATPKHFIAHGSPTSGLNLASVEGGKNTLMNFYLKPFKKVFEQCDPLSVMNCYSSYEGEAITGSKYYLTGLLRDTLHFKGYVYSDWGSVAMLNYFQRTARNEMEAAYQAITAGIDLEASSNTYRYLKYMVENGILDERYIDRAVRNVLYVKFACGLFDEPIPDAKSNFKSSVHTKESIRLAKKMADESIVLLKNEKNLLPLDLNKIKSLAIIGPSANILQVGDYSWIKGDTLGNTPLNGIKALVNDRIKIHYAKGCDLTSQDSTGFKDAISKAKMAEVALVFVGSQSASLARDYFNSTSGEGFDLSSLKLPGVQEELLHAVAATGTTTILILVTGRPFEINWAKENVPAILTQFYGGEQQGNAIADVLFGNVNPSGKLPVSFPQSIGQLPVYYNHYPTDKGFYNQKGSLEKPGRDYVFSNPSPAYPFGFGLSYTSFDLTDVKLNNERLQVSDTLHLSLKLSNTGSRDGSEVVQAYIRDLYASIVRPVKELKAFQKVRVPRGGARHLTLQIPISELVIYDAQNKWTVESGEYEIQVGVSSDSILYRNTFEVYNTTDSLKIQAFRDLPSDEQLASVSEKDKYITLCGVIRDVQATPIPEVEIIHNNNKIISEKNGRYRLKVRVGEKLLFRKRGYQPIEHIVNADEVLNIRMKNE